MSSRRERSTSRSARRDGFEGATATEGLTNARTRIVGARSDPLADAIVAVVRLGRVVGGATGRAFVRISTVVTPLGWTMLALVPVGFVAGYRLGWIELVVVAWTGLVLILVAALYLLGPAPLDVRLALTRPRVVVGEQAAGEVVVTDSRRRGFGTVLEVPVGAGLVELVVPPVSHGAAHRMEFAVPALARGVVTVGPVRTVRADPVGIIRRELTWTTRSELIVHPRTINIPSTSTGVVRDLEGSPTRDLTSSDVAFHALREYSPGDERRYIHWKSTAKTGTYMVRQFEETRRSHLLVALSCAEGDYASDDEFELAVSVAASIGVRAIRDARDVSVVVGERTPEFAKRKLFAVRTLAAASRSRLLDDCARLEKAESALRLPDTARVSAARVTGVSVAFLVCGSTLSAKQLRAAATQFAVGVEVIAVVCDPEAVPGLRHAAGFGVLTIGYLEDLQKALARAVAA